MGSISNFNIYYIMKDSDFLILILVVYGAIFFGGLLIAYINEKWY